MKAYNSARSIDIARKVYANVFTSLQNPRVKYSAGINGGQPPYNVLDATSEQFMVAFDTNVFGVARVTEAFNNGTPWICGKSNCKICID